MLGHRGCRLGISHPEIYEIQIRAIVEAAYECDQEGVDVNSEIMVPLISTISEFKLIKELALDLIKEYEEKFDKKLHFKVGTMIDCHVLQLLRIKLAEVVDFFSFGTNDLTQTTFLVYLATIQVSFYQVM